MAKGVPNKRYSGEFQQMVVETMMKDKLSYRETAEIPCHKRVAEWEHIDLSEGAGGLYVDRRGHRRTGRPATFPKEVEEDLLAEVQESAG